MSVTNKNVEHQDNREEEVDHHHDLQGSIWTIREFCGHRVVSPTLKSKRAGVSSFSLTNRQTCRFSFPSGWLPYHDEICGCDCFKEVSREFGGQPFSAIVAVATALAGASSDDMLDRE